MTTKADRVDMSPRALRLRLQQIAALYKLMVHFRKAKVIGPVEARVPTNDSEEA